MESVWSQDLADVESVALVGDRIVLVQLPTDEDTDAEFTTVTAKDLGTGRVLWSRRVPVAAHLFIVGSDGQPHWPQPGISVADEASNLIMGLSVVDGHTVWKVELPTAAFELGLVEAAPHASRLATGCRQSVEIP